MASKEPLPRAACEVVCDVELNSESLCDIHRGTVCVEGHSVARNVGFGGRRHERCTY